jgi:hypothetical protein
MGCTCYDDSHRTVVEYQPSWYHIMLWRNPCFWKRAMFLEVCNPCCSWCPAIHSLSGTLPRPAMFLEACNPCCAWCPAIHILSGTLPCPPPPQVTFMDEESVEAAVAGANQTRWHSSVIVVEPHHKAHLAHAAPR